MFELATGHSIAMLDFAHPLFLWLLPLAPLAVWRWLRRPRPALGFSDLRLFSSLPPGRSRLVQWAGACLRGGAILLLIMALAGPRWPDRSTRLPTEGIAIQMVLDASGSMAEPDFTWQGKPIRRIDAAKRAFRLFVEGGPGRGGEVLLGRPDDSIGLVAFATWPESPCPLTLSHSVLMHILDAQQPRAVPTEAHTNIGDAIAWALARMENAAVKRKVIVLLSDGEHNVPYPAQTPRQAAQLAANLGVPIYAIDAGGEDVAQQNREGDAAHKSREAIRTSARDTLQAVAQLTGGKYFRAGDTASLLAACGAIDRLERNEIQSFHYRRYYEAYFWAGIMAFAMTLGIACLEKTIWLRLP